MARKLATIFVNKLQTTARYVDHFTVECYSDSALTTLVAAKTSKVQWDGSTYNVQKDLIEFDGLEYGNTYYLRAGVVAPISGAVTWSATWSEVAGTPNAPQCSYTYSANLTTAGVTFTVTPANVPSNINHYDVFFNTSGTAPTSTDKPMDTKAGSSFDVFVPGKPGQTCYLWVRGVNTAHDVQAWETVGNQPVANDWSGTLNGTAAATVVQGADRANTGLDANGAVQVAVPYAYHDVHVRNVANSDGTINNAAVISGRTEQVGTTLQHLDNSGMVLNTGIDFSRNYTNQTQDYIGDGVDYARTRSSGLWYGIVPSIPQGRNLCPNPGFEANRSAAPLNAPTSTDGAALCDDWTLSSPAGMSAWCDTSNPSHGGSAQLTIRTEINQTFATGGATGAARVYSNLIPVRTGQVLSYGGYYNRQGQALPANVTVGTRIGGWFYDNSGNPLSGGEFYLEDVASSNQMPSTEWISSTVGTVTVPAGAAFVKFQCAQFLYNNSGSTFSTGNTLYCDSRFDDVFLIEQTDLDNEIKDGKTYIRKQAASSNENLIENGNFTAGTAGWNAPATTVVTGVGDADPWGKASATVGSVTTSNYGGLKEVNNHACVPGDTYVWDFWFRSGGAGGWVLYYVDEPDGYFYTIGAPTGWTHIVQQFTIPASKDDSYHVQFVVVNTSTTQDWAQFTGITLRKVRGLDSDVADGQDYTRPLAGRSTGVGAGPLGWDTVVAVTDTSVNYGVYGSGFPNNVNTEYIYARWDGFLIPSVTGLYTLGVNSDDGANLFVDGVPVANDLGTIHGMASNLTYTQSRAMHLTAGTFYHLVLEYEEQTGGYGIQLLWTPPGGTTEVIPAANLSQNSTSITGNIVGKWWNGTSSLWYPTGSAYIDFAGIHANKNLDNIADTINYVKTDLSQRDGGGRAYTGLDANGVVQVLVPYQYHDQSFRNVVNTSSQIKNGTTLDNSTLSIGDIHGRVGTVINSSGQILNGVVLDNSSLSIGDVHGRVGSTIQKNSGGAAFVSIVGDPASYYMKAPGSGIITIYDSSGNVMGNQIKRTVKTEPISQSSGGTVNDGAQIYFASGSGSPYLLDTWGQPISPFGSVPAILLTALNPPTGLSQLYAYNITKTGFQVAAKTNSALTWTPVTLNNAYIYDNSAYNPNSINTTEDQYASVTPASTVTEVSFNVDVKSQQILGQYNQPTGQGTVTFTVEIATGATASSISPVASSTFQVSWASTGDTYSGGATLGCSIPAGTQYMWVRIAATGFTVTGDDGSGTWVGSASYATTGAGPVNNVDFVATIAEAWS